MTIERPPIESQITFLYSRDLKAARAFYEETMGLPLWLDQGACCIYQVARDAYLGLCQAGEGESQSAPDPNTPKQGNVIFTLVTEEVDGWYTYLSARGVAFEKTPAVNERYQIYNCFLRDPDGYLIEIQRFMSR